MKILMIDKFYFIMGGAERYYFELSDILESHDHQVIPFSMNHPDNFSTPYSKYFVDFIDYDHISFSKNPVQGISAFMRMIYSTQAQKRIQRLIDKEKPDIAHIHMIDHQLSPSILDTLKKNGIPIIQTVHQYKLVCPNYRLYNMRTKNICEKCLGGNYFHPLIERCHKNSFIASFMISMETSIHKFFRLYEKNIDLFHVPSSFMGAKLIQAGIDKNKVDHLFYTIDIEKFKPHYECKDYFVYYGRLALEKGIMTLLKSMHRISSSKLVIVGDGPQKQELKEYVESQNLKNVIFAGLKYKGELTKIISNAKFVVVPSEWYDNSPLVIYESFAMGKPVIGSNIGGIPELIKDKNCGLIFDPGNSDMLAEKINCMLASDKLILDYGKKARKRAENNFGPDVHYQKMMEKYNHIL
ncbi:MAG: glycosyltransferase family 4 protein [bacterium]